MSLTVYDYLKLRELEQKFPAKDFYDADRQAVIVYALALFTSGIPGDASREKDVLIELIIEYAFRRAFCNWVRVSQSRSGGYSEWKESALSLEQCRGEME